MRKLTLILIFAFCLFTFDLFCQSITWQRLYDGPGHQTDDVLDICKATDDYFYAVGTTVVLGLGYRVYVLKLNQFGDTIWTNIINTQLIAYAVAPSNDGGCVLMGAGDSAFAIKINSNGAIAWQKFYGGTECYDIITTQGGYIACGRNDFNPYILKIDENGTLEWQRTYLIGYSTNFKSISAGLDNGYIIIGSTRDYSQDTVKGYVLKIDSNGNQVWDRKFRIYNRTTFNFSISNMESGYLIGGNTRIYGTLIYYPFFVKISLTGDTLFSHVYSDTGYLHQIRPINLNRYVMSITVDSNVPPPISLNEKARIIISDSVGTILREKVFFNGKYDELTTVLPINNGDIIFSGYTEPLTSEFKDIYLVRTDSNLNAPAISIEPIGNKLPLSFKLYQNYPNPFNPLTTIKYDIPKDGGVSIKIYDITGKEVFAINEYRQAGSYSVTFDGTNFASGLYLYRIKASDFVESKKMILIK